MGRSGPSEWRRWHRLGGKVLIGSRRQQQQRPSRSISWDAILSSGVREKSSGACPCGAPVSAATLIGIRASSFSFKGDIGDGFRIAQGISIWPNSRHSWESLSTSALCPGSNATLPWGRDLNRKTDVESLGGDIQLWTHRSEGYKCGHARPMSSSTRCPGAEQPAMASGDQESPYTIFPSQNLVLTAKSARRGAGFIAHATLDQGNGMSRASKLPLHSALPSLRNHRLGDASLTMGLQGVEASAFMPANEVVDWQQQRLGKRKDYDPRFKPQRSSPHSDAEPDDIFIPVKAFYISRSVDLKSLAREPFLEVTTSRNNLIIRCADRPPHSPVTADNPEMACLGFLKERYMVTFQYGSVVFFNFGDLEEVESLDIVRKYCSDEFREARKDDYGVLVRPTLSEWSEGGHDRVMLRKLDIDNIRVISSILGQSIALDHYAKKVDEMVTTFSELNRGMEQTGTFTMTRKSLFQLVAAANTTLADVILRLGLLERSDAAWKDANYAQIWEYLRDDFELDERFESLDFKLNIIQHNVRFFLDILQNRKSDTLEWIIILLITGEICVSLYDILHTAGAI